MKKGEQPVSSQGKRRQQKISSGEDRRGALAKPQPSAVLSLPTARTGERPCRNGTDLGVRVTLRSIFVNRRIPNGTYGGVRGRGLAAPSYSIVPGMGVIYKVKVLNGEGSSSRSSRQGRPW